MPFSRPTASAAIACAIALSALPAIASDAGQLRLRDDFELGAFDPAGGLYYKKNAEQGAGRVEFQSRDVRHGKAALSLSVEPQCAAGAHNCSERAEVWEKTEVLAGYGEKVWYAFSMKLADPVPQDDHRYVMAQWKRQIIPGAEGDFSPFLALRLFRGRLAVTLETTLVPSAPLSLVACADHAARVAGKPDEGQTRILAAMEGGVRGRLARAKFPDCAPAVKVTPRGGAMAQASAGWNDFVFSVKPGPGGDGAVEIIANGQWVASVSGPIGHAGPGLGEKQYFKFGPYRAGHAGSWSVLYDDFRRGPSCADVAPAEVCARVAP